MNEDAWDWFLWRERGVRDVAWMWGNVAYDMVKMSRLRFFFVPSLAFGSIERLCIRLAGPVTGAIF